ncbi:MAG: signal peptide peptidase SppA [Pseudomonadota bacterium]
MAGSLGGSQTGGSKSALGRFFGGMLAIYRFIRSVLFNLLFLFVLLMLVVALIGQPPVVIQNNTALLLNPTGVIVEQRSYSDPLTVIANGSTGLVNGEVVLQDLLDAISTAKDDNRISSMLIMTDWLQSAGLSQLHDLGLAIDDFKTSGKKVYAWGSSFDQGQYLLASKADEVLMNSYGQVGLEGFGVWQNYFQSALAKLGVNVHIFRVGEYKSAVEPFSRSDMSPESRSNYTQLLNDLWGNYISQVEGNRGLAAGTINDYVNRYDEHLAEYQGNTADLALALNLVDRIDSRPAGLAYLQELIGTSGDELKAIEFQQYLAANPAPFANPSRRIALIVAEGEIIDGEAPQGTIGGDTLGNLVREVANDDDVEALVLRINSPGGSAFASEIIRGELAAFKASGRPIVVSMGDTAASGGYWISTPADQIWASANTLTGSIGIFGTMFTLEESFSKLGIGTDGVSTTELAGYAAAGRPLPDMAGRVIQQQIEHGYTKFIDLVAESRDMDPVQVDAIAQGQVWSGQAALNNGLVDQLGTLDEAIAAAATLIRAESYQVELYEPMLSPFEQFLKQVMENATVSAATDRMASLLEPGPVQQTLRRVEQELDWLNRANDPQHAYVRCLECSGLRL